MNTKLIECRSHALEHAEAITVRKFGRYFDVLALFKNQWHYITTIHKADIAKGEEA